MRPYRRRYHSSWRTRMGSGLVKEIKEALEPFIHWTRTIWKMDLPFPVTAKVFIITVMWFFLFLPLCYFLVPPLATLFFLNCFSLKLDFDDFLTRVAEKLAESTWPEKVFTSIKLLDKVVLILFFYDIYKILKRCRLE